MLKILFKIIIGIVIFVVIANIVTGYFTVNMIKNEVLKEIESDCRYSKESIVATAIYDRDVYCDCFVTFFKNEFTFFNVIMMAQDNTAYKKHKDKRANEVADTCMRKSMLNRLGDYKELLK